MKVLQLNTTLKTTSTGRITEEIGQVLQQNGHESYIAYGKMGPGDSSSNVLRVGNHWDFYLHGVKSRLMDRHGFGSKRATQNLVKEIEQINPDVIGLHNLHGYYLNIEVLFNFLKRVQKPVIWTFHDCWPFTGHCSFFDFAGCQKWKTECSQCPLRNKYPASWIRDNSRTNFHDKRLLFNGLDNLVLVTPSQWLKKLTRQSFLSSYPVRVIHNGVDLTQFKPVPTSAVKQKFGLEDKKIILGVASIWDRRKGLNYFIDLSKRLDDSYTIVLVGLARHESQTMPQNIMSIPRTESIDELVALYNIADVFVNPTLVDNFPTTNIEALACGTPVITFDTGGSPEAINPQTGVVVEKRDVNALHKAIEKVVAEGKAYYQEVCRARAVANYDKHERYAEYIELYHDILQQPAESLHQTGVKVEKL